MEPPDVQLLVHISASCGAQDDARYRKEGHNLLAFLGQSRVITHVHPVDEREISTDSAEEARSPGLAGSIIIEPDLVATCTPGRASEWRPNQPLKPRITRSRSDAAIHLRRTPEMDAVIQVGRTPAVFTRETPLERPKTAPAVIKETPLGLPLPVSRDLLRYDTPPSTVPDSQPSHSSFKRAFIECATAALYMQLDTPAAPAKQCAKTAPPVPSWHVVGESADSSHSKSAQDVSIPRPSKRAFGIDGNTSSPSPPKRRRIQPEQHQLPSSSNSGAQADAELSSSLSWERPVIYEDSDAHSLAHRSTPSTDHPSSLNLRSSQSSQNRQASQPEREPDENNNPAESNENITSDPSKDVEQPPPRQHATPSVRHTSPSTSRDLITAPRPPTGTSNFSTHLTAALSLVRSKLAPTSKYYVPTAQRRSVQPLERGCWRLAVPELWIVDGTRDTFWTRLSEHIRRGRAGFGTWIERCGRGGDGNLAGASFTDTAAAETWRVWCWGEVHVEVWLLLYVDSGGKVRGLPLRWEDGAGETVVQM